MRSLLNKSARPYVAIVALCVALIAALGVSWVSQVNAASTTEKTGQRLISIHEGGTTRGILTDETTLRKALKKANITVDPKDLVEPGLDHELVAGQYDVNIYRARPVTIVDGSVRTKIISPYQTASQIADHAKVALNDEDTTAMAANTDMVSQGVGLQVVIDRATPFTLIMYGKKIDAFTQAETVGAMLKKKNITFGSADTLSVDPSTPITAGMTVELWRNGKQTITEEQEIAFPIEQIKDADREVGYKDIKTPGEKGKKTVSYDVEMKNGVEISRTEIQSVTTKEPKKQVEVIGAKLSFSGDFQAALAKLRSCEGGYNSWNPAGPYYGAYQFDKNTWASSAPAGAEYGNATPEQQDQAAWNLYKRRGWQPWPVCGAQRLPDIYR